MVTLQRRILVDTLPQCEWVSAVRENAVGRAESDVSNVQIGNITCEIDRLL